LAPAGWSILNQAGCEVEKRISCLNDRQDPERKKHRMNDTPTAETESQASTPTGEPGAVMAQNVTLDGGSVESVTAETVTVNGGNIGQANAVTINLTDGGIAQAQGSKINVTDGGIALARADSVSVTGGGVGAAVARRVEVNNGSIAFVAAGEVGGDAKVVFDLRAAIIFALVLGAVLGLLKLLMSRGCCGGDAMGE
jgi:hypothetical protein